MIIYLLSLFYSVPDIVLCTAWSSIQCFLIMGKFFFFSVLTLLTDTSKLLINGITHHFPSQHLKTSGNMHNDIPHASDIIGMSWKDYLLPIGGIHQWERLASCPWASCHIPWEMTLCGRNQNMYFLLAGWLLIHCNPSFIWLISPKVTQTQSDLLVFVMWMNWLRIFPKHTKWERNGVKCTILVRQKA